MDQGTKELSNWPNQETITTWTTDDPRITELERKVAALEEMLKAAKIYDEAMGNPDCELAEKKQRIQELADELGVPINLP